MTPTPATDRRPIGTLSIDVKTIYERMIQCPVGGIVRYEELNAIIGRDIRGTAIWILSSARRRAFSQNQIVFGTVSKIGLKRLNDSEIVSTGHDTINRVRRMSRKGVQRLSAVQDYNALPNDKKLAHNTYVSALGILAHVTRDREMKRLETVVEAAQGALPLQHTLEAFKG